MESRPQNKARVYVILGSVAFLALVVLGFLVLLVHRRTSSPTAPRPSSKAYAHASGTQLDVLRLGGTLTQTTNLNETLPAPLLSSTIDLINLSLAANGTTDPEPSPGVYDWSALDARLHQVAALPAIVAMRVYDAPPWMKGKDDPHAPIAPEHYKDFAALVVAAAQRYPQIHYFAIWNELFGYRPKETLPWDYQSYTNMYNVVYTALKSFNPKLEIGGPYVPFPPANRPIFQSSLTGPWGALDKNSLDTVTYWLQHKVGADFLAVDGRTSDASALPRDPVGATELFSTVDAWLKTQTTLPIWWMEWYARGPQLGQAEWDAVSAYALLQLAASGATDAFLWDAEFIPKHTTAAPGLWIKGTGQGTALAPVFRSLKHDMYNTMVTLHSPMPGVEVLDNGSHYIAVDTDGLTHTATILGRSVTVAAFQITTQ